MDCAVDFVEADLAAGRALLRVARAWFMSGAQREGLRALGEAEAAWKDGARRLAGLSGTDLRRLRPELEALRAEIDKVQSLLRPSP